MANQHVIELRYKSEGGTAVIKSETIEGDLSQNGEYDIPAGSVDAQININIPSGTTLQGFAFACNKKSGQAPSSTFTGLGLKTNNAASPAQSFIITPTNGICWSKGDPDPNPITTTVTSIYVTNTGSAAGNLVVRTLIDSTPVLTP